MLRLGLTGSIATGKTTVLERFAALGVPTYSADAAVHALYEGEAAAHIEALFPGTVHNGAVDRARLSAALAAAPKRFAELESLIHPLVRQKALEFFDNAEASGAPMAVIEIPLLFETGANYPLDATILTHCAPDIQRRRALSRPGMTAEKFELVMARQMPQTGKMARADHLIDTSTSLEDTRTQVEALVGRLRADKGEL